MAPARAPKSFSCLAAMCILIFLFMACGDDPVREITVPEKDTANFRIPKKIQEIAPLMREHLILLLPFQSSRFRVKPEFVFIEGPVSGQDDLIKGRLNPLVMNMSLIHLAYYRDDDPVWSGSILKGRPTSTGVSAKAGFLIKLTNENEMVALYFQDGDSVFQTVFPHDRDYVAWLERGVDRLFLYHYVLPQRPTKKAPPGQPVEK